MRRRSQKRKHISVVKSLNNVNTKLSMTTHIPISMLVIALVAALMIGAVWQKVKIGKLKTEIESLRQKAQFLKEENENEKAKMLNLLSDYRIVQIAQKEREMTFPPYDVISIPKKYFDNLKKSQEIIDTNH